MGELTRDEEDVILRSLDPEIVQNVAPLLKAVTALVNARQATAWDEGAYAAGYCCCDPSDNPHRPKETP